ncbi:hypothetical protein PFISCL1PPCAC_27278, partial [Pristionchus fissidentatus]
LLLITFLLTNVSARGTVSFNLHNLRVNISGIDCHYPFGRVFNHVEQSEQDCEIYIRICTYNEDEFDNELEMNEECSTTSSFLNQMAYSGTMSFPIQHVTSHTSAMIQFRSLDDHLDHYLSTIGLDFDIDVVKSGKNMKLRDRRVFGYLVGTIDCGEGYSLAYSTHRCEKSYVSQVENLKNQNAADLTENVKQTYVDNTKNETIPLETSSHNLIHCEDLDCGSSIIFWVIGSISCLILLSMAVCCLTARSSRKVGTYRFHESTTTVPSVRSRSSVRDSHV